MARLLSYIVIVAALVSIAVWMADHSGSVTAEWLGWRVETTVPVLLAGLIAAACAALVALRTFFALWHLPDNMARRRRDSRLREGYQALSDGLVAAVGGEAPKARKLAGRADKLLGDPALTTFLSAQAAKLSGDGDEAKRHFTLMLDRPETASLGLKGLLEQALEEGDDTGALDIASRAFSVNAGDPWLANIAFKLTVKDGQLDQALELVAEAARRGGFTKAEAARRRALVLDAQAGIALSQGETGTAARLEKRALRSDSGSTAAAIGLARAQLAAGRDRRAARTLERAWERHPARELVAAYTALRPDEDALSRAGRMEKLVAGNPDAPEAHLALGMAALDAKLWGQARKHLQAAAETQPGAGLFTSLARLEREEYGDTAAARAWEEKAAKALPDPAWVCAVCSSTVPEWSLSCPRCGAIDALAWKRPGLTGAGESGPGQERRRG